jgi:hypothetical protein
MTLDYSASVSAGEIIKVAFPTSSLANPDLEGIRGFVVSEYSGSAPVTEQLAQYNVASGGTVLLPFSLLLMAAGSCCYR